MEECARNGGKRENVITTRGRQRRDDDVRSFVSATRKRKKRETFVCVRSESFQVPT